MKKIIAITMTVLLLCCTITLGVCAEGFAFREISREWNGNNLIVTWNQTEAGQDVTVEDVLIGGKSYGLSMDANRNLIIDLSSLPAGVYSSLTYEYVTAEKQNSFVSNTPLVKTGVVTVTLTAAFNADGALVVTATDASGAPVANYSLKLTVGRMANISGTTDAKGKYESPYTASEGETAIFEGVATEYQGVQYAAVAPSQITRPITATTTTTPTTETTLSNGETTTAVEETTTAAETTTTEESTATTTTQTSFVETLVTIQGAGTTSKVDKQIALNISTDTGILGLFELKRAAFDNQARLLLSPDDYAGLIGRTSNTLMLNVLSVEKQVSYSTVQEAMKNSSFKHRADEQWKPMTFNLSLLMLDRSGNTVPVTVAPEGTQYTVQLPVPASLKECSEWAITTFDGNKLMAPQSLTIKDGCLTFQTNSMGEYVIIGFPADANNRAGGVSWRLTVLLLAGILLLVGAGFVLYWFVLRTPKTGKKKENVQEDATPLIRVEPESDADIFSGRTDIDISVKEPENDEQE